MEQYKKYFGGWFVWIVFLFIITGIIFIGLSYFGIIGKTIVERKVFENSYQKQEADKTASTVYDSQLSMLRARLNNPSLTPGNRAEILAQIDAIIILKTTKED